ncbi:hypothetical protein LTR96_011812 [Exophiala xenobiotica]|nr:hypothetical protein LTR96_011812 [Exophiala xenobiotica]
MGWRQPSLACQSCKAASPSHPSSPYLQISTLANDDTLEPPGKHWPQYLYARHPELKARRLKAIDWARANESIYEKVAQWFDMIGKELSNDGILRENVYNMDETGVLLGLRKN